MRNYGRPAALARPSVAALLILSFVRQSCHVRLFGHLLTRTYLRPGPAGDFFGARARVDAFAFWGGRRLGFAVAA